MAGIITNKAVVVGSTPRASSTSPHGLQTGAGVESCPVRPVGQEVAYCGRVPVRVRGVCFAGDTLAPSGLNDGTAVAIRDADLELSSNCQSISECGKCTRQMLSCCRPMPLPTALVVGVAIHDSIAHAAMGTCALDRLNLSNLSDHPRCSTVHSKVLQIATDPHVCALCFLPWCLCR